jgi:hypothetical protein
MSFIILYKMEKIKSFAKKHPVWTGVIGIFILFILIGIFSGGDNSSTTNTKSTQPIKEEIKFSKSITDANGDCDGTPCKEGIDIISASLNQKNGFATAIIELSGNVPSASELKEIKDGTHGLLWPEIYQYVVYVKINGEWVDVLFGDVRADTKKAEGGCGVSYLVKKNIGTCDNSQVSFLIEKNKVTISGPLKPKITSFKIQTLYEASMDEDSVTDVAEIN